MKDYIVRAIAADSQIRAFAAVTTETVETARQDHNTSPVVYSGAWPSAHSRNHDWCNG